MMKEDLAINIANFKDHVQRELQIFDAIEEALENHAYTQALPLMGMLTMEHNNLRTSLEKIQQIIELTSSYNLLVNEDDYNEIQYMLEESCPLSYIQETFLSIFDRRTRIENKIIELMKNGWN